MGYDVRVCVYNSCSGLRRRSETKSHEDHAGIVRQS